MKELLKRVVLKQSQIKLELKKLNYLQEVTETNYQHEINGLLDKLNKYKKLEEKLRSL